MDREVERVEGLRVEEGRVGVVLEKEVDDVDVAVPVVRR